MARKNTRRSNKNREISYKDVEKALEGRNLNDLTYKDMYELEQLGFGDWLKRNAGNIAQTAGGALLTAGAITGAPFTGGATLTAATAGLGMLSSGVSGFAGDAAEQGQIKAQNQATLEQNALMDAQAKEQAILQNPNQLPSYGAVYATGGFMDDGKSNKPMKKMNYFVTYKDSDGNPTKYPIPLSEVDNVKRYLDTERKIADWYGNRYKTRLDNFNSYLTENSLPQTLNNYREYARNFPDSRLPPHEYNELENLVIKDPSEYQNFSRYRDIFIPRGEVSSDEELQSGVVVPTRTHYGGLNYFGGSNLNFIEEEEKSDDPKKKFPVVTIAGTKTPTKDYPSFPVRDVELSIPFTQEDGTVVNTRLYAPYNQRSVLWPLIKRATMHDEPTYRILADSWGIPKKQTDKDLDDYYKSIVGKTGKELFDERQEGVKALLDFTSKEPAFTKGWKSANDYEGTYAYGGYRRMPRYAQGGTINYSGQSHEGSQGGIPIDDIGNPSSNPIALTEGNEVAYNTGDGTYIFSDRLKYDDKKTFAARAKAIQNKYRLRGKTKGSTFSIDDPISRKGYDMDMQELIGQQEKLKEMTMPQEQIQQDIPMFPDGGYTRRKGNLSMGNFPGGPLMPMDNDRLQKEVALNRYWANPTRIQGQSVARALAGTSAGHAYIADMEKKRLDSEYNNWLTQRTSDIDTGQHIGTPITGIIPSKNTFAYHVENLPIAKQQPVVRGTPSSSTGTVASNQLYQGMNPYQAGLAALPDIASGITNIVRGSIRGRNNPYTKLTAPQMMAEQVNLENERAALREQANVARANTSRGLRMGAPTAGSYMANMVAGETGIQRELGQRLGQSYQNEAATNAQMRQQAAMANQQMEMQARGYNAQTEAQNRAQGDAMVGAGISQIGQGITGAFNQYTADKKHVESLNMMSPNYALYETTSPKQNWLGRTFNRSYERKLTPEGVKDLQYRRESERTKLLSLLEANPDLKSNPMIAQWLKELEDLD